MRNREHVIRNEQISGKKQVEVERPRAPTFFAHAAVRGFDRL
jgi:hypothetical protein